MSSSFIADIEAAVSPVLAKHFYSKSCPKNITLVANHAVKMAAVRFIRSQTNSPRDAVRMLGVGNHAFYSALKSMGYDNFTSIPKDEWKTELKFIKK